MNKEKLDLSIFEKAIASLGDALQEYDKDNSNDYVRDPVFNGLNIVMIWQQKS